MTHKNLDVWKSSIELVVDIYRLTSTFPGKEQFVLTSQINRAAISIPLNIAEGAGRASSKEFIRFLDIATGSLSELETLMILVEKLNIIESENPFRQEIASIRKMIFRLKQSLQKKT